MTHGLDVAILGAGGFGREVLQYSQDARAAGWPNRVVGFIDNWSGAFERFDVSVPLLGSFGDIGQIDVRAFIIAVGDPALRRKLADAVVDFRGILVSLIHPTAYVAPTAQIGSGTVLCPYTLIAANSWVGPNVAVNVYASIGHDSRVGGHCVISPYAAVTGAVSLGDGSFLGTHCTIAPAVAIGACSKVSAGSVVTRDAEAGSLLIGNPAKGRVMYPLSGSG
ncbi:putative acetyltransferase EpsM [bacterium BMS3Bbin01]|nr:putative acetyltransferase EpsM [bacterium BMS3Bbin01]